MEFIHMEKESELLERAVQNCLSLNGNRYAENRNIKGVITETCTLYPAEHYCKYAVVLVNDGQPQRMCLYEILHYEG